MSMRGKFERWIRAEVRSKAVPAVRQFLERRQYTLVGFTVHGLAWRTDVYHPRHGLFEAEGRTEREALVGILRQVWLIESIGEQTLA